MPLVGDSGAAVSTRIRPKSLLIHKKPKLSRGVWSRLFGVWSRDSQLYRGVWSHILIVVAKFLLIACATRLQIAQRETIGHEKPMAEVHQLIVRQGVEEARRQAATKHERALVEAAYQVMSEEAEKLGFTYSGFALTCLPHKPQSEPIWRREGHNLTMLIQSGVDRSGEMLGVPYGSYARFILLFLQSQAIKTGNREIELGRSMRVWLGNMGLSIGGTTYRMVNEQARRISGCNLTFYADRDNKEVMRRGGFVDGSITLADIVSDQPSFWQEARSTKRRIL